jgi:hypothetical protein
MPNNKKKKNFSLEDVLNQKFSKIEEISKSELFGDKNHSKKYVSGYFQADQETNISYKEGFIIVEDRVFLKISDINSFEFFSTEESFLSVLIKGVAIQIKMNQKGLIKFKEVFFKNSRKEDNF